MSGTLLRVIPSLRLPLMSSTFSWPLATGHWPLPEVLLGLQAAEVIEGPVDRADGDAGHAAGVVEVAEEQQVFVVVRVLQRLADAGAGRAVAAGEQVHVVLDQPGGAPGERAPECIEAGGDVIL